MSSLPRTTNEAVSRRDVLRTGVALGGALMLGAPAVRASDKSGLGPIILGSGEHQYECTHDWAQLPSDGGIAFGNTHGVAFDKAGNCYIKHTVHSTSRKADAVCVFDPDGRFVRSFGAEYRGGAHGLHLAREKDGEFLYLADCNRGVVQKTTLTGEVVLDVAWPEASGLYAGKGEYKPTNIAVVTSGPSAGDFYVADGYGKNWIHRYNAKGEYQGSFGGPGKERGQVSCPHGIAVDERSGTPTLVVADRSNRRLQTFTLDGRHLSFVTAEMRLPCHFDVRGDLLLVPDLESRVTLLGKDNTLIVHLGDGMQDGGPGGSIRGEAREKFVPGKFICPHSAAFDNRGNIVVVEWVEVGRVTRLRKV